MAIIKAVNSRASIANTIRYITKTEKTDLKLISGINCTPDIAIEQMKLTKTLWNKTKGRQYKHFVQSFPPNEKISHEEAHKIAEELIKSWDKFKGYEVIFATHKDREHIHTHIVVNSVSCETGMKFRYSKKELQDFKDLSDQILMKYNKNICQKNEEITTDNIGEYKAIEKSIKGEYESWVVDIMKAVNFAKENATSISEFIYLLKNQGIETVWKDSRKYITFSDNKGKKIRNKRLAEIFKTVLEKEVLINEFERNYSTKTRKLDTTAVDIEYAIRNRQTEQLNFEIERRKSEKTRPCNAIRGTEKSSEESEYKNRSIARQKQSGGKGEDRIKQDVIREKQRNQEFDR